MYIKHSYLAPDIHVLIVRERGPLLEYSHGGVSGGGTSENITKGSDEDNKSSQPADPGTSDDPGWIHAKHDSWDTWD